MSHDDHRPQQTAHAGQVAGMSARERVLILGVIGLVGVFIVAMAGPLRADPPEQARLPDPSVAPSPPAVVQPQASPSAPPPAAEPCIEPHTTAGDPWAANACAHRRAYGPEIGLPFMDPPFVDYSCPANGRPGPIWGTLLYTDDSSVCSAAVHQGFITLAEGGTVRIRIEPGLTAYSGRLLNGVKSEPWGQWGGSFRVVGLQPSASPGGDTWEASAVEHRGTYGSEWEYACPPDGTPGPLRGTDFYTDESSVCTAAVHQGVITLDAGGPVRIIIRPGLERYAGTVRNGIASEPLARWDWSFVVVGRPMPEAGGGAPIPPAPEGPWGVAAVDHRGAIGQEFAYECPPNGTPGIVWGTDIYTDDSSVCTAAVHKGVITLEAGGSVRIVILAGLKKYAATSRNGIVSTGWDQWEGSFEVVEP